MRDQIDWFHGQGFPKNLDVERAVAMATCTKDGRHYASTLPDGKKARPGDHLCERSAQSEVWDGHGTALKPAFEPCIRARKPLEGTVAENVPEPPAPAVDPRQASLFGEGT